MAKRSYQMLEIWSYSDRERALPLSVEINILTFVVRKVHSVVHEAFRGVYSRGQVRKLKMKCRPQILSPLRTCLSSPDY